MELGKLKEAAGKHGVKVGFFKKGLYKQLAQSIPEDSEIELIIEGYDPASLNAVPVVVCAEKVYMAAYNGKMGLPSISTFKRERIEGVEIGGGVMKTVNINMGTGAYSVSRLKPDGAQALMNALS